MRLAVIVSASRSVASASGRLEKIARLAECLREAAPGEVPVVVAWLSGELAQGRIGVGPAAVRAALPDAAASSATLTVADVERTFTAIAGMSGAGSTGRRRDALRELFGRATAEEQRFLAALLFGELRQGAQEGIVLEAVARAADVDAAVLRRAAMLAGDLPAVAGAAFSGEPALTAFRLRLLHPVQPMLAQTASDVGDAIARLGEAGFEYKLDGARVQVHRSGRDVRVFTRGLHDVTASSPDIVEAAQALPVEAIVLDGEAIGVRRDGRPLPFQMTMRRFARRADAAGTRRAPLRCFFFDCLHVDGTTLIDAPARERWAALERTVPAELRVPRMVTDDAAVAAAFLDQALREGHEGLVAKAPASPYETGARGAAWLKIKPAYTLDLVVLAADWGHGRRRGWLSNLHLGARDGHGGWVMLGKTFKGMTDALLTWQTAALLEREVSRTAHTVIVEPTLVVEIALDGVLLSSRYPGGVSLRFARVRGYRQDKRPEEADTIEAVRALLPGSHGPADPGPR